MTVAKSETSDHSGLPDARPIRDQTLHLSRRGLVIMLAIMAVVPVATVLVLWWYLPPVAMHELKAEVRIKNLETAERFNRLDPLSGIPEPLVEVKNVGDTEWTHVIVEINGHYKLFRWDQIVKPGDRLGFGLDLFVTRDGIHFAPGKIPIKRVRVYARLPSGSRATCEFDYRNRSDNEAA